MVTRATAHSTVIVFNRVVRAAGHRHAAAPKRASFSDPRPAERVAGMSLQRRRLHSWLGVHEGANPAPSFVHQTAGAERVPRVHEGANPAPSFVHQATAGRAGAEAP